MSEMSLGRHDFTPYKGRRKVTVVGGGNVGATCALEVENEAHAIVGWKVVEIDASDRFTRSFTDTVRTSQPSVTGLIYRCWLT